MSIESTGLIDIQQLVEYFKLSGGMIVTRRSGETVVNRLGEAVEVEPQSVLVDPFALHPASPWQLRNLPEGVRTTDVWACYTWDSGRLQLNGQDGPSDEFEWQGRTYEIVSTIDHGFSGGVLSYMAARKDGA